MLNFNYVLKGSSNKIAPLICFQSVRWRRLGKPFWLGTAKSKMFVVPQSRVTRTQEETKELLTLRRNYNTILKSILKFITKDNPLTSFNKEEGSLGLIKLKKLQRKEKKSLIKNEEWNAVSLQLREKRLAKSAEKHAQEALIKMEDMEKKKREWREKIEEAVKLEKEKSKSFITRDRLDEAIENCLKNIVEYNFAIDLKGNKYTGKDPITIASKDEKSKLSEID